MSTDARRELGRRLKNAREAAGLSQEHVAAELGLPRPAISLIETGSRKVDALELARLAKLYGHSLAYFADEGPEPDRISILRRAVEGLSVGDREKVLEYANLLKSKNHSEGEER